MNGTDNHEPTDRYVPHPGREAKRTLPKRFYKKVDVVEMDDGFGVTLDGRQLKTPNRMQLAVASKALAARIADEWDAQREIVDVPSMWLTKMVNTAIDRVEARSADVLAELSKFAYSDLTCYRADHPEELVHRQAAAWQPITDWIADKLQIPILVTSGIQPIAQHSDLGPRLAAMLSGRSALELTALHTMTTLTGSVFLALGVADKRLTGCQAFEAAHIDETWQAEQWGRDEEAEERLSLRHREFEAAVLLLDLIDATSA